MELILHAAKNTLYTLFWGPLPRLSFWNWERWCLSGHLRLVHLTLVAPGGAWQTNWEGWVGNICLVLSRASPPFPPYSYGRRSSRRLSPSKHFPKYWIESGSPCTTCVWALPTTLVFRLSFGLILEACFLDLALAAGLDCLRD